MTLGRLPERSRAQACLKYLQKSRVGGEGIARNPVELAQHAGVFVAALSPRPGDGTSNHSLRQISPPSPFNAC